MGLLGVCLIWFLSYCARLYSIGCENNSLQLLQGPHAEQGEMYTYPGTTSNQFKSTGVYLCLLAPSPGHCGYCTISSHLTVMQSEIMLHAVQVRQRDEAMLLRESILFSELIRLTHVFSEVEVSQVYRHLERSIRSLHLVNGRKKKQLNWKYRQTRAWLITVCRFKSNNQSAFSFFLFLNGG